MRDRTNIIISGERHISCGWQKEKIRIIMNLLRKTFFMFNVRYYTWPGTRLQDKGAHKPRARLHSRNQHPLCISILCGHLARSPNVANVEQTFCLSFSIRGWRTSSNNSICSTKHITRSSVRYSACINKSRLFFLLVLRNRDWPKGNA